jgi:erythronate-4-phosphate dehydrogenase
MNIVADENIPYVKEAFSSFGHVATLTGRDMTAEDVKDADILLVRSVTKVNADLLAGSNIKFVASATIGFDHIDLDYLAKHNIGFARAPASNAISASEYVITAIAYWSKKNTIDWSSLSIGIIGCGNVGSRVKARCEAVGIKCIVNDPPLAEHKNNQGVDDFRGVEAALACDIVTLHVPLSKTGTHKTFGLLNKNNMHHIKQGALVINTARGYTIEEDVLHQRPDLNLVLDCWQNEPEIDLSLLEKTVLSSAHIAGYSLDGKIRGTNMIYQACCSFFKQTPQWSTDSIQLESLPLIKNIKDPRDALLQAYPIEEDSQRLRNTKNTSLSASAYFDQLRKNYPIRREFAFWQVDASTLSPTECKILSNLQFQLMNTP